MTNAKARILWKSALNELSDGGAMVIRLIGMAYSVTSLPSAQPVVIPCWSSMLVLPDIDPMRATPLLILNLPADCSGEFEQLATSTMTLNALGPTSWAQRTTCLELGSESYTVQLRAEHILPVLRMVATGAVVVLVVCGDKALMVEHVFTRRELLKVCSELYEDDLAQGSSDDADTSSPHEEYLCTKSNGVTTWFPLVTMFDRYEQFFYGAVRSQKPGDVEM